jgi:hypothetical protein
LAYQGYRERGEGRWARQAGERWHAQDLSVSGFLRKLHQAQTESFGYFVGMRAGSVVSSVPSTAQKTKHHQDHS